MSGKTSSSRTIPAVLVVLLMTLLTISSAGAARNPNPRVLPPHSHAYGASYAEWSERWWQWALSIPAANNPLLDTTGQDCDEGQAGKVWFLAGTFSSGPVERSCTLPTGKAIFFPILNIECSVAEGNGTTEAQLRACATNYNVELLEVTVDGRQLRGLTGYRAESEAFTFALPEGNVYGLPSQSSLAVSDGFWVMLPPLPPGKHTVHLHGIGVFPGFGNFRLDTEVTYHLTVR